MMDVDETTSNLAVCLFKIHATDFALIPICSNTHLAGFLIPFVLINDNCFLSTFKKGICVAQFLEIAIRR